MFYQYQVVELVESINTVIKAGLRGVILEVYDNETFEVEFLDEDGINYEFNGKFTFTLKANQLKAI
jgi:hypothetical protein